MTDKIDTILAKYWEGDTTLDEESELRLYFSGNAVDPKHEELRALFEYFLQMQGESSPLSDVSIRKAIASSARSRRVRMIRRLSVAASFLLIFTVGIFLFTSKNQKSELYSDTFEDPMMAYAEVTEALALISQTLNHGKEETLHLTKAKSLDILIDEK